MANVGQARAQLRRSLIEARESLGSDERARLSRAIEANCEGLLASLAPKVLGFCWPIRGEFDPLSLVRRRLADGGRAALPWIVAAHQPLRWREWRGDSRLVFDRMGIPVPAEGSELEPDALLIPVVGFDAHGFRLGYGGGYFDRTMAAAPEPPVAIGVGFELGRLTSIAPEPHDVPLDYIITEAGIFQPVATSGQE